MSSSEAGPAIVVGIDGSKAATQAALWGIDEAVDRDIPLRLVCVVDGVPAGGVEAQQAAARSALYDAYRAVEAVGKQVKIETEILWGKPVTKLIHESRFAPMICVGAMGLNHARSGQGSVAGTLAGAALCPVAVIQGPSGAGGAPEVKRVVVEVDNGAVLRHAFREARLRGVPLRAVSVAPSAAVAAQNAGNRLTTAQLDRRLARWTRLFPDVPVESAVVGGHGCRYLADDASPGQLVVTDSHTAQICNVYNAGSSVMTVRCSNL